MPLIENVGTKHFRAASTEYASKGFTYLVSREEDANGNFIAYVVTDGKGNILTTVTDETKADVAIQAAIDALPAGGKVALSEGRHHWSFAPTYSNSIVIEGQGSGTIVELDADITPFNLSGVEGCQVKNLDVEVSYGHTAAILQLEGKGNSARRNKFENVNIRNPYTTHDYTGISLLATDSPVFENQFKFIRTHECNKGINFEVSYTDGWINVNYFEDIWAWHYVTALDMEITGTSSYNLGGNEFVDVWGETASYSTDGFKVDGTNYFLFSEIVDWGNASFPNYQWHILPNGSRNVIINRHPNIFGSGDFYDEGTDTEVINPNIPIAKYKNLRTVSASTGSDYQKLSDAFNDISPSATDRYTLLVFGKITDDAVINAKSYTDVIGYGAEIECTADDLYPVSLNNISNAMWRDLTIRLTGSPTVSATRALYLRNCDDSVRVINVKALNETSASIGLGIEIYDGNPYLENCTGKAGGDTGHAGLNCGTGCYATLVSCTGIGSDLSGSRGIGAVFSYCSPTFINCTGIPGKVSNSQAIKVDYGSAAKLVNCLAQAESYGTTWAYTSANNGRFQPFSGHPYQLIGVLVRVNTANSGVTLDLGTSIGGTEIASGIDIGTTGYKFFSFNRVEVAAGDYMYATPSASIGDGDIRVWYSVIYNYSGNTGLSLENGAVPTVDNCTILANGASDALAIDADTASIKKFRISNSHIETYDPTNQYAINSASVITGENIKGCSLVGQVSNVTGIDNKAKGQQTFSGDGTTTAFSWAHGLSATPSSVSVTPASADANGAFYVTANATDITVTFDTAPALGTNNVVLNWFAEV